MIDVPIAVCDALKDGGYKKNYRFVVGDVIEEPVYETVTELSEGDQYQITEDGDYRLFNGFHDTGFTYEYSPNGRVWASITVTNPQEDYNGGYYDDGLLTNLVAGSYVRLTDANWTYILQIKTEKTEEAFVPDFGINNSRLVKESVKIDERMCSDDSLKFGLCEGSSLEFQAFDIENITGRRIKALLEVKYPVVSYEYDEETNVTTRNERIETYTIPMGYFDVQESSRQASTGIRKISAYNKLKSDYLDQDAKALIVQEFGTATIRVLDILNFLLRKYGIKKYESAPISPTIDIPENIILANAKKYFTPYKYTSSDPNITFTEWALAEASPAPTGKNMYMEGNAKYAGYLLGGTIYNLPIQIEVDEIINQIDSAIADYLHSELAVLETCSSGRTADQMWNDLLNMVEVNKYITDPMKGYFFQVVVRFFNTTTGKMERRVYSNQLPNATGTFDQLNRTTFLHVSSIDIITPFGIRYGHVFDSYGHIKQFFGLNLETHEFNIENFAKLTGNYGYGERRTTPKLPDNSSIPDNIYQYFRVKALSGGYSPAELIEVKPDQIQSITLRDLQTAVFETNCQFGKLDRVNNYFTGVELNNRRLYPADSLYPDDELYPVSTSESGFRAIYSKLWADEGNIRSWRNLIITYKGLIENEDTQEHEEAEKIYTAVVDANGTDDYNVTANWLFKNLLWADSESESWQEAAGLENIEDYAAAMVNKMQSVSWFPFEMWCAGLPYVETGDEVEIIVGEHAYTSYVLRRTIKGIQNLQDEMINGTLDIF